MMGTQHGRPLNSLYEYQRLGLELKHEQKQQGLQEEETRTSRDNDPFEGGYVKKFKGQGRVGRNDGGRGRLGQHTKGSMTGCRGDANGKRLMLHLDSERIRLQLPVKWQHPQGLLNYKQFLPLNGPRWLNLLSLDQFFSFSLFCCQVFVNHHFRLISVH